MKFESTFKKLRLKVHYRTGFVMGVLTALMLQAITLATFAGCGKDKTAHASGSPHAIEVPGPVGVTCYGIINSDGWVVGGNCK